MITKIICPVDFERASLNAAEYAAQLAKAMNIELKFFHLERIIPVASAVSMAEGIGYGIKVNTKRAQYAMTDLCNEIYDQFGFKPDYEIEVGWKSLKVSLRERENMSTLIVMGSNGAEELTQYLWGSNTYNVLQKAICPLLIIPENTSYKPIEKIVFAWDYSLKNKFSFSILNELVHTFETKFTFLHVSKENTEISKDVFNAMRMEVLQNLKNEHPVEFVTIYSKDIAEAIENYMSEKKGDLLALSYYNHGWTNFIHGKVVREISENEDFPVLVVNV